jgi:hypothetical protein
MKTWAFLFACFIVSEAQAQVQSWPPGGQQPSPYALLLPNNRFVPSSKRYNLIWADQFFGLPAGQIEFVGKNYTGTQKNFYYQANDYRAFNPNFLVLTYHLALGLNPRHHDDCPQPHTLQGSGFIGVITPAGYVSEWLQYFTLWLAQHSISVGSSQYEQMFQHYDVLDSAHRAWHSDPYWLMNPDNNDWRNYMGDQCVNWMNGNENEGCFLDVSVETMTGGLYHPNQSDPAPYNFNWYISPHGPLGYTINTLGDFAAYMNARYTGYYQYLYTRFHTGVVDFLVMPNVDQMITAWYDPAWLDGTNGETIDGVMMESFGNATTSDMYLSLERGLRHITGRGKILIAQFYNNTQPERYRRTGMYMLIKNENSFVNIVDGNVNWFPEYEIDLGDQSVLPADINPLRVAGSGSSSLFKRDYASGMVLCNTSSNTMTYTLSGNGWNRVVTSGGGTVDTSGQISAQNIQLVPVSGNININASDCVILKNTSPSGIKNQTLSEGNFSVAEDLSSGEITIQIESVRTVSFVLNMVDSKGSLVKNIVSGDAAAGKTEFKTDLNNLPQGVYFIRCTGEINQSAKILKF